MSQMTLTYIKLTLAYIKRFYITSCFNFFFLPLKKGDHFRDTRFCSNSASSNRLLEDYTSIHTDPSPPSSKRGD